MILETLINLLGQDINDGNFHRFTESIGENPGTEYDIETQSAWFYFYNSGFMVSTNKDMKLDDIRVYFREDNHVAPGNITPYKEAISENIGPESTKSSILLAYGAPTREGALNPMPLYPGDIPIHWILYDKGHYWIRFRFTIETGKLEEVTLMTPESVPGNRPGDQELAQSLSKL